MLRSLVCFAPTRMACPRATRPSGLSRKRERPGCRPVSQNIGACGAALELAPRSVRRCWTESRPAARTCALPLWLIATASARFAGVGDGIPPHQNTHRHHASARRSRRLGRTVLWLDPALLVGSFAMSHAAVAAVLAMNDATVGERLTALSLASFANREHRAWPSTRVAAARAGLSRSQYLAAREGLVTRGLVVVDDPGGGRGRASVVSLALAGAGPWFDGDINAELLEAVLSHSRSRGSARVLLATLAAVADRTLAVAGLSSDEIRHAAGMADSTYRRGRAALLSSNEIVLEAAGGGRAITNRWIVCDPASINPEPLVAAQTRPTPPEGTRPLLAAARQLTSERQEQFVLAADEGSVAPRSSDADPGNPAQDRTVSGLKGPGLTGVSALNPGQNRTVSAAKGPELSGVSAPNPGQDRTVSGETPPQTPSETPPRYVRAGREPQNPESEMTPLPPLKGGVATARSRSLRTTSATAAVADNARSPSALRRPDHSSSSRPQSTIRTGGTFALDSSVPSAGLPLRFGCLPSS